MLTLGIDTSDDYANVALSGPGFPDALERTAIERRSHLESLAPLIRDMLAVAEVSIVDIRRVVVVQGPGGWSGLRIGVATAKVICEFGGAVLVPVSTFAAVATAHANATGGFCVAVDGGRKSVHMARFVGQGASRHQVEESSVPWGEVSAFVGSSVPLLVQRTERLEAATSHWESEGVRVLTPSTATSAGALEWARRFPEDELGRAEKWFTPVYQLGK